MRRLWAPLLLTLSSCEPSAVTTDPPVATSSERVNAAASETGGPSQTTGEVTGSVPANATGAASAIADGPPAAAAACPEGMLVIEGGSYWAGAAEPGGTSDEHPRHQTRVHRFCMDRTEVTTEAYEACVARGQCQPALRDTKTCNSGRNRPSHPINCVSWEQAEAFCRARGARLPSELEWEYAARGGAEHRTYSWGNDPPDGNTCWKHVGSCEVATHREGAFGLHDMNGNVWEWTETWYAPYPWPAQEGYARIYRGGSWSRRFEKWLSLSLRNRQAPREFGSHLGFRCAALASDTTCPYGQDGERCRFGVDAVECAAGQTWNGVRCAKPGETGCAKGQTLVDGHGCTGGSVGSSARGPATPAETKPLTVRADHTFDADCQRYQPTRPHAMRFEGGTHAERTAAGTARGCKNRDVGVGWNSACCP